MQNIAKQIDYKKQSNAIQMNKVQNILILRFKLC